MSRSTVIIKLGKKELSHLIDYLITDLQAWSEKGFESKEEKEQFQHIISVVSKLREAIGDNVTLFL